MANTKAKRGIAKRAAVWVLLLVVVVIGVAAWANRETISGVGNAGTAYAARIACSCRFVAGRSLESCEDDLVSGMEMVALSDDVEARSVTATLPLIQSTTATHRVGYGCVLEEWDG